MRIEYRGLLYVHCSLVMTRKAWVLAVLAAVLGGIYAYYFTDWINVPRIQILKSDRPVRYGRSARGVLPVAFTLDGRYALTEVKVVPAAALATNKHPNPLWHLVTTSNSPPIKGFIYGQQIRGMQPLPKNARPQPLQPGVSYRLYVAAGRARGEIDFQAQAAPESGR